MFITVENFNVIKSLICNMVKDPNLKRIYTNQEHRERANWNFRNQGKPENIMEFCKWAENFQSIIF
jgi:hypothetical protein